MPLKSKKPLITKNWLPVEYIHGVPNIVSSNVWISQAKKAREAAGKPPIKRFWCQYCGRPLMSIQALRGHLLHCPKREAYKTAMRDGFRFTIGSQSFIVRTARWSWLRAAEQLEKEFNRKLTEGESDEATVLNDFSWYIISHQDGYPSTEAYIEPLPVAEGERVTIP